MQFLSDLKDHDEEQLVEMYEEFIIEEVDVP